MFSNGKSFTYDPDYNNWKSKTQTEYWNQLEFNQTVYWNH